MSWLIPFVASFLFYKPDGELVITHDLFKSLMIVVAYISGCYLLYRYFILVEKDFIKKEIIVGLSWFTINIVLDTLILMPMMKVDFATYFMSIGMRYCVLPAISISMGYVFQRKLKLIKRISKTY